MKRILFLVAITALVFLAAHAFAEPALVLDETSLTLAKGKTAKLTCTAQDLPEGEKIKITWSTENKKVATAASGTVTGAGAGDTKVTASATLADGTALSVACAVHVYLPVTSLSLGGQTMTLNAGQSETLALSVKPEGAEYAGATFESSDPAVLTVDGNGIVTALIPGTATVTATSTEPISGTAKPKTAKIKVTVNRGSEAVAFASPFVTVGKGKNVTLKPSVLPEDTTNKKLNYESSDSGIAAVSATGQVTGKSSGQCVVTATAADGSGASASCVVNVVTAITALSPESKNVTVNTGIPSQPLGVKFTPSDATCQRVAWESSDPETAEVDENGVVLGKKPGKVTITATSLEETEKPKTASFSVTVNRPASSFVLTVGKTVPKGSMITPEAIFQPADTTITKLSWESSNPKIADVTSKGQIRGVGVGKCTLTATTTDGTNLSQTCEIEVIQGVTSIKPQKAYLSVSETRTVMARATVSPSDATDPTLEWSSDNTRIAKVDSNGKITGVSRGICTITAAATDGSGKKASIKVTVEPKVPVDCSRIVRSGYFGYYTELCVEIKNITKSRTIDRVDFSVYLNYKHSNQTGYSCYYDHKKLKPGNTIKNWYWKMSGLTYASDIVVTLDAVTYSDGTVDRFPDEPMLGWFN